MGSAYFKYVNAVTGLEFWENRLAVAELAMNPDPDYIKTCKKEIHNHKRDVKFWGKKVCY